MKTILLAAIFILLIPSLASAQWWNSSWLYRAPINITNNNITQTLEQNYTLNITFNHSQLVSQGKSLASGNDTRIVWYNSTSGNNIELDRLNTTPFNNNTNLTVVWFKLQQNISANQSDTNYYLYYGNPSAGSPPQNGSNVFLNFTDNFNDGVIDPLWKNDIDGIYPTETGGYWEWSSSNTGLNVWDKGVKLNMLAAQDYSITRITVTSGGTAAYANWVVMETGFIPQNRAMSTDYVVCGYWRDVNYPGKNVYLRWKINGASNSLIKGVDDFPEYVRLIKNGTTYYCEHSNDGITWSSANNVVIDNANFTNLHPIVVYGFGGNTPNPSWIRGDDFYATNIRKYLSPEPSAVLLAEQIIPVEWSLNTSSVPSVYSSTQSQFNITWKSKISMGSALLESNFSGSSKNYSMNYNGAPWWSSDYSYRQPINITNNNLTQVLEKDYTANVTFNHSALVQSGKSLASGNDIRMLWHDSTPWWNSSWQYRKKITITNNNLSQVLEQNYTVNITLDTTGSKFVAAGNDTRIVWWNGTNNVELDRINTTAFNAANTSIWFKLQQNISANSWDDNYYVYYGNPSAGAAPANGSNVFLFYDDFNEGGTCYNNNIGPVWSLGGDPLGSTTFNCNSGYLQHNNANGIGAQEWASTPFTYTLGGIDFQFKTRAVAENSEWNVLHLTQTIGRYGVEIIGYGIDVNIMGDPPGTTDNQKLVWSNGSSSYANRLVGQTGYPTTLKTYRATRDQAGNWSFYVDNVYVGSTVHTAFTQINYIELWHVYEGNSYWDDIIIRKFLSPEPSAALGAEQGQSRYIELDRVNTTAFNNATNLTVVWFKTQANIPAGGSDANYSLYYGNPSAGAALVNGSNVFLVYDSWEDGNYNANPAWAVGSASYVSIVTSPVYDGAYSLQITYQNTGNEWADTNITPTSSIIYETWWRDDGSPDLYDQFFNSTGYEVVGIHADAGSSNCVANNGGNFNSMGSVSTNTWYRLKLVYDGFTVSCYRYNTDGTLHGSSVGNSITNPNNRIQRIRLSGGGFPNGHNLIHDVLSARKYMSPEPTALLLGEQNVNQSYTFSEVLPAGSFYWKSYANNSAGAWNSSDTWYFSISKVPTLVRLFLNGTEGNKNYIQNLTANFTAVINITGKTVYLQTDLPGWVLQSGTGTVINITNMTQKGLFNVTAYFPGDQNYSSSLQTYFAKVIIPGLYEITTNLALHLGSAFADDSLQSTNQYVCIQDSTGWFGLIGEGGSAKAGNISTEYNINTSFISDNKALLATSKGTCVTFTRYVSSILAKSFLSPLQAFAYAKTNLLQFILKYDYADFLNDLHWSSGTYQVSVRNEGYDSSSGKQKLGTKLVK